MDDKRLEERLHLLKDSYERIPSEMDVDAILNKIEEAPQVNEKKNKGTKWQRVTVWAVSIASVFIIGVLSADYLEGGGIKNSQNKQEELEQTDDLIEYAKSLKDQYEKEREKRRLVLDIPAKDFKTLSFVQQADGFASSIDYFSKQTYESNYYTSKDRYKELFGKAVNNIHLPSEMVGDILKQQEKLDEAKTSQFFNSYYSKIIDLKIYFNKKQNVTKKQVVSLEGEGLYLENGEFHFNGNDDYLALKAFLVPTVAGYLEMLEQEPYTYAGELVYSLEDSVAAMMMFENSLLESFDYYSNISTMKGYYTEIFHAVVKGTKDQSIYGDDGKVKEEYRQLWKAMMSQTSNSPVNYILPPIVKEFEASNWRKSDSWESLNYGDIDDALHLAINGDLGPFIENLPSGKNETSVDDNFVQRVHALYKLFAGAHDQTVLKDAKPEEIVGLYYYCAQLGDKETKYELYIKDDQYQQIPKEEYMKPPHQKITDFRKEFSSLHFEQRSDKKGYVVLTLHPDRTLYMHDEVIGFAVIHTENGWRVAFMPTQ
ncbi:hypothetical protein [Psychrobacillus sp. NPDC093180]|uniref:hypothetical protein n=1 Tax=Psychrobacillus sp. NPDC093180 TaxID=3364489 RepID=UPI0037FEAC66